MNVSATAANGNGNGRSSSRAVTLRGAWRLGALLFVAGAVSTIPGTFVLDSDFEPWMYAVTGVGILSGVACLLVPWWRASERWLLLVPVVGAIEVALSVALTDFVFSHLYFFVGLYIGLVFPRPRQMAPLLALLVVALFVPSVYESEPVEEALLWALAPGIVLTAIVVGRLTSGLEASRETYRRLSSEDGLTGVGNYRSLIERLRHETSRHHRHEREFAVLTLDLDNFKTVNETQGHLVGDLLLALAGSMLDLKVRAEDAVFRQGGDELSVIAPEAGRKQAELLAGRIKAAISLINSGELKVTASVGCAVYPEDGLEAGELLDAADPALLERKREIASLPQRILRGPQGRSPSERLRSNRDWPWRPPGARLTRAPRPLAI
ncbi:MAG: GGDEF domain-containing protein [Actinobacteria bacterium]|nr:GGDEF domain-containing protein [Actinomycetota bacterium]